MTCATGKTCLRINLMTTGKRLPRESWLADCVIVVVPAAQYRNYAKRECDKLLLPVFSHAVELVGVASRTRFCFGRHNFDHAHTCSKSLQPRTCARRLKAIDNALNVWNGISVRRLTSGPDLQCRGQPVASQLLPCPRLLLGRALAFSDETAMKTTSSLAVT